MKNHFGPFVFKQFINLIKSTARKARNLRELREMIASVSDDCLFPIPPAIGEDR